MPSCMVGNLINETQNIIYINRGMDTPNNRTTKLYTRSGPTLNTPPSLFLSPKKIFQTYATRGFTWSV